MTDYATDNEIRVALVGRCNVSGIADSTFEVATCNASGI